MYLSRYDLALHVAAKGHITLPDLKQSYRRSQSPFSSVEIPVKRDFGKDVVSPLGRAFTDKLVSIVRRDFPPMDMQKRVYIANHNKFKPHTIIIPVGRVLEEALVSCGYQFLHRVISPSGSMYYVVSDDKKDQYRIRLSDHVINKPKLNQPLHGSLQLIKRKRGFGKIIGLGEFGQYFQIKSEFTDAILDKFRSLIGWKEEVDTLLPESVI